MPRIRVDLTNLETHRESIYRIRKLVFIDEQAVPEDIEMDEHDATARHVLAYVGGELAGTGRITADGRIGRMAVLAAYRGQGVGREILLSLMESDKRSGASRLCLSAQCHAIAFYEKFGFVAEGPVYQEAGIDHRWMEWSE
ncbi:MAG: GNAT family N-acetyltransferase [Gammaproteobacteria bacterium]|nr:MAG: GNAT family N-acetyltransferase [Gammaproteobacteria bacterium]